MQSKTKPIVLVAAAILGTIKDAGAEGAPLGPMYAAVMDLVSYDEFTRIIESLKSNGMIRTDGFHVAYYYHKSKAQTEAGQ